MKISWIKDGTFLLKTEQSKVLIEADASLSEVFGENDIDFVTYSRREGVLKSKLVLDWPGEYEVKGIGIDGISLNRKNGEEITVFILKIGKVRVCHLGFLDRVLTDKEVSSLGDIDILFVPVGGGDVLDAKQAHNLCEAIDPRMIIPMNYTDAEMFKKEMGIKEGEEEKTFIDVKTLPEEQTQIVILKPERE